MKISDIITGYRYADLGTGKFDEYDTAGIVRSGVFCTVLETLPGGKVKVQYRPGGPEQVIAARRLHQPRVLSDAIREQADRDQANSRRFDERLVELEEARQRILRHLVGVNTDSLGFDLDPKYALGKPVKAHSDRSGYWTGTGIRLDYVQIADLLDKVAEAGDPDRTTDLEGEYL